MLETNTNYHLLVFHTPKPSNPNSLTQTLWRSDWLSDAHLLAVDLFWLLTTVSNVPKPIIDHHTDHHTDHSDHDACARADM